MTNNNEKKKDLVVFLDAIGRTIIAERTGETDTVLVVENPAVVNIIPQQAAGPDGQPVQRMALQLFPLFFREFLAAKEEPVRFRYNKNSITMSDGDIALDFKVAIQYEQLFANVGEIAAAPAPSQAPAPMPNQAPAPKISLFDDDDK